MEYGRHTRRRPRRAAWACTGTCVAMLWGEGLVRAAERYDDHALIRVHVADSGDVATVRGLGLDIWNDRPGPPELLVRVAPEQRPMLDVSGLDYEIVISDLQPRVDAETLRLADRPPAEEAFYADFRTLDEIDARLVGLAGDRPDLVELFDIGPSLEGRSISGLRIAGGDDKPAILVTAGTHAREWISMMAGTYVAESFVSRADDPGIAALLEQVEVIVVPVVNPDGYVWSWEVERFWRKNRRDGFGVDLNRNFAVAWGGEGSSGNPDAGNYRGTAPLSEPEAVAVAELVESTPAIVGHVDVHSFGQLVLHPWGHVEDPPPADASLSSLATELAAALGTPHDHEHTPLEGLLFYPAAGNIPDWMYAEHGIHSFTFELRPDEADPFPVGFLLPPEQILAACEESLLAIEHLAQWSADQAPGEPGDDDAASTTDAEASTDDGVSTDSSSTADDDAGTTHMPTTLATTDDISSGPHADDHADEGCGCRTITPPVGVTWVLAWLVLAGPRRRPASQGRGAS